MRILICTILFLFLGSSIHATDVYVAAWGNDSNSGSSWVDPKVTINAAGIVAGQGGTIYVGTGTWSGAGNVNLDASSGSMLNRNIIGISPTATVFAVDVNGEKFIDRLEMLTMNTLYANFKVVYSGNNYGSFDQSAFGFGDGGRNLTATLSNLWIVGMYDGNLPDNVNGTDERRNGCAIFARAFGTGGNHYDGTLTITHCLFERWGRVIAFNDYAMPGGANTTVFDRCTFVNCADTGAGTQDAANFWMRGSGSNRWFILNNSVIAYCNSDSGTASDTYAIYVHAANNYVVLQNNIIYYCGSTPEHNKYYGGISSSYIGKNTDSHAQPEFITTDGRDYVTVNVEKGWYYVSGLTGAPPVITTPANGSEYVKNAGEPITIQVDATDPDTPTNELIYSVEGLPSGASFSPVTHIFSWPSPTAGKYSSVKFTVSDGERSDSVGITIYVLGNQLTYYVSTNGVDSAGRDGLSTEQSWKTINYSLSRAADGNKYEHSIINVGPGIYADERSGWQGKTDNWHINIESKDSIDIVGAGPDATHVVQGNNKIWEVDSIFRIQSCAEIGLKNMRITVTDATGGFINSCIRIDSSGAVTLDNLWISGTTNRGFYVTDGGTTTNMFRNGDGVGVFGNTGTGGIIVENVLIRGFGRAFYTEAKGGYNNTNLLRYCTFAEQDGEFDTDDGVAIWSRANPSSEEENHIFVEKCIFANLPANGDTFGLGMRVDSFDNLDDLIRPILFSDGNLFWNCGDGVENWYQPDLQLEGAATNDVSFDPQFLTNSYELPYSTEVDYGWHVVPEPMAAALIILLGAAYCLRKS